MPKKPMSKNTDSSFTFTIKSRYAQISIVVLLIVVAWGYMFDVSLTPSQRFLSLIGREVTPETSESEPTAEELEAAVIPKQGYTVNITWGDIGTKLVAAGGIDLDKYKENYSDAKYEELLLYLTDKKDQQITITSDNSYFWINTLWAPGLTQKSVVLDEGVMGTEYRDQ
ncbi:MAG: hypothetical protein ACE5DQ_02590, partial [Candidatus Paceibacterota bacterium]